MPTQAPSLGELTNIQADPERGTGTPAVVTDTSPISKAVQTYGQIKQENDWKKYTTFLGELKDVYKDGQDIASMDMAGQDRDAIKQRVAKAFDKIGKDPQAFFGGGKGMEEIQKDLAGIRSDATQSKQDYTYDLAHRHFLTANPEFATPDNMKKVDSYLNQPLGKRKSFLLQPQPILDFDKMASSINAQVGHNFAQTGFTGVDAQGNRTPGSNYIVKEKGKVYNTGRFMTLAESSYDAPGEYGIKNRQAAESYFKQLDPETQKAYGNAKNWYLTQLAARHKENEIDDTTLVPNRFAEMTEKQKFDQFFEDYKQDNRIAIADHRHNLSMGDAKDRSKFLLKTYAAIVGNKVGKVNAVDIGNGKYVDEQEIDLPPDLLKKLNIEGKTTIKEGPGGKETVTLSQEPDQVTRTEKGDVRIIRYQRYPATGPRPKGKKPGDIVTDQGGSKIIESQEVVPKRQVLGLIGSSVLEKKVLAGAIDDADDAMDEQSGDIGNYLDNLASGDDEGSGGDSGVFDTKGLAPVQQGGQTFYVNPKTRKVYDSKGKEVK